MLDSVVSCGLVARPKSKEKATNVGVPDSVHAQLSNYCEKRNLILRDTVGAIGAFFMAQPSPIKRIMLGDVDPELQSAYVDFLERMLESLKQPPATFDGVVDENQDISESTRQRVGERAQADKDAADAAGGPINARIAVTHRVGSDPPVQPARKSRK